MNLLILLALFGVMGILFFELFMLLRVMGDIQRVFNVAPAAVQVIRSDTLSDDEKEKTVRRMSLTVLRDTGMFTVKLFAILAACVALAAVGQWLFKLSPDGLTGLLASWQGLLAAAIVAAIHARLRRSESHGDTDQYSFADRLLHRVAFAHPVLQRVLGDVENDLYRKEMAAVRIARPVFVTGLPRAGTTLLLELLHDTGEFASFTYRQMPFVLNPLLWNRLSSGSRRHSEAQERAHGDGMMISYDSPEAFEEVLWINYLGKTLLTDSGMEPLGKDDLDERFRDAFVALTRKLVCLKSDDAGDGGNLRYLSKNNANLSRLGAIRSVFTDADLLCCYRHPASHVASLHTQHLRFLDMHADDAFARDYMRWIGHHDFGANFRPICFDQPIADDPAHERFWLHYWIDAYRHVLEHAPKGTLFIGYESLMANGRDDLAQLATTLGVREPRPLIDAAKRFRKAGSEPRALADIDTTLAAEAEALFETLRRRSQAQGFAGR